ncbi:Integrase OS=Streptomyces microflavus OX=1919 GN=Smic_07850 PE=4 SV=1 [Streptomyces microflavus]
MRADRVPLLQADGRADSLRISTGDLAPLKTLRGIASRTRSAPAPSPEITCARTSAPELLALAEDVGFENDGMHPHPRSPWRRTAHWCRGRPRCPTPESGRWSRRPCRLSVVVTSALSGMRNSELLELSVGCRRQTQTESGGTRYRLAGRLIKGQKLGGVPDEWVVIEDVHRAVALAERLLGRRAAPRCSTRSPCRSASIV